MNAALCILLFGAGGLVRDGQPSYKVILAGLVGTRWEWLYHLSTQLARFTGALLCAVGALCLHDSLTEAAIIGVGVLGGFYLDTDHGEAGGDGGTFWSRLRYRLISGATSLLPLGLLLQIHAFFPSFAALLAHHPLPDIDPVGYIIVAVALAKPPIWGSAWFVRPDRWWAWLQPTRVAAILFCGLIGAAVAFIL